MHTIYVKIILLSQCSEQLIPLLFILYARFSYFSSFLSLHWLQAKMKSENLGPAAIAAFKHAYTELVSKRWPQTINQYRVDLIIYIYIHIYIYIFPIIIIFFLLSIWYRDQATLDVFLRRHLMPSNLFQIIPLIFLEKWP